MDDRGHVRALVLVHRRPHLGEGEGEGQVQRKGEGQSRGEGWGEVEGRARVRVRVRGGGGSTVVQTLETHGQVVSTVVTDLLTH